MTTRNYTTGAYRGFYPGSELARSFLLEKQLDCSADNQTAADIAEMLDMLAGYEVLTVMVEVITPEGAALTVDVGDGVDPNGWGVGFNGNAAGFNRSVGTFTLGEALPNTILPSAAYGLDNGKLYTAADTIDILFNNNASTAVIRIAASIFDWTRNV